MSGKRTATRNPNNVGANSTDLVLHKSQQAIFNGLHDKVIDFSEQKLLKHVESVTDPQQRMVLMALISDYRAGHVAIAWQAGNPTYVKIQRA